MGKVKNWLKKFFFGETYIKELHRDAETGKFVTDEFTEQNPSTTTTEIREVKKRGKNK